jgi:hypothetical protein
VLIAPIAATSVAAVQRSAKRSPVMSRPRLWPVGPPPSSWFAVSTNSVAIASVPNSAAVHGDGLPAAAGAHFAVNAL